MKSFYPDKCAKFGRATCHECQVRNTIISEICTVNYNNIYCSCLLLKNMQLILQQIISNIMYVACSDPEPEDIYLKLPL